MTTSVFSAHDLRVALKEAGLPYSRTTLWQLEGRGVIPKPKRHLEYENRPPQRLYTRAEITKIVAIIRKLKTND